MNFEGIVVFLAFILYFIVGISYLTKGEYAWSLVWMSYSIANLGLILTANK